MRASELSIDLNCVELTDLGIYNTADDFSKSRQRACIEGGPESPGSASGDTDGGEAPNCKNKTQISPRQKCGRPANPIPRHKRDSHIKAEYKRRDKIQKGFETLKTLVPDLADTNTSKESKSAMLYKTADYCHRLKAQCGEVQNEAAALRQELEALGSQIHDLQDKLPESGLGLVEKPAVDMDALYSQYVQAEAKKDWKFSVFSYFMRPLYKSYKQLTSSAMTAPELTQSVSQWMKDSLSLTSLRKGIFDALRKLSTQTSIMTSPEKLEEELMTRVNENTPQQEESAGTKESKPNLMKPPTTPPPIAKSSGHRSRSRPSSPPGTEVVKQRRRSSNRSDKGSAPVSPHNSTEQGMDVASTSVGVTKLEPTVSKATSVQFSTSFPISPPISTNNDFKMITTDVESLMTSLPQLSTTLGQTTGYLTDGRPFTFVTSSPVTPGFSQATMSRGCTPSQSYQNPQAVAMMSEDSLSQSLGSSEVDFLPDFFTSSASNPSLMASFMPQIQQISTSVPYSHASESTETKSAFNDLMLNTQTRSSVHSSPLGSPNHGSVPVVLSKPAGQVSPVCPTSHSMGLPTVVSDIQVMPDYAEGSAMTTQSSGADELDSLFTDMLPMDTTVNQCSTMDSKFVSCFRTAQPTVTMPGQASQHVGQLCEGKDEVMVSAAEGDNLVKLLSLDLMDMNSLMQFLSETDDNTYAAESQDCKMRVPSL